MNRSRALALLAKWSRLPAGFPDALDQLRQQLQAMGIDLQDRRAVRLAERAMSLAEDLHSGLGEEPEYVKRARLNYALARLCGHLESTMVDELAEKNLASAPPAGQTKIAR
jgi:uncharacterized protein YigA (DUF484 family)